MTRPTLTEELKQFLYTHAANMAYKKDLLAIVVKWESAYLARIDELEVQARNNESSRMISEGGPASSSKRHGGYPDDDDDRFGNHY